MTADDRALAEQLQDRLRSLGVTLEPVGNGVTRLAWTADLQAAGVEAAAGAVHEAVEMAFTDLKQARVEVLLDPDDLLAARVATYAGLRKEGVMRGAVPASEGRRDRIVMARLHDDVPVGQSQGFRALLNSFLPRKRAIAQMLVRDTGGRVLLCSLTYKADWDLPGGVVEVNESPQLAVSREVEEELGLTIGAGPLLLTDWLPAWSGWDDAVCLVFDGGEHDPATADAVVPQPREIREARFCTMEEVHELCADFTARRVESALRNLGPHGSAYTESGRP